MKANVLIFLTDQQRWDTINAGKYSHMVTPNLDRLVKEGCIYENAYSSNPVCMPARHDLLTGFPARKHGYYANNENQGIKDYSLPTLPRIFSQNGYRTVAVGKMHFCPTREHHGFDEMILMEELPRVTQHDQYLMHLKENGYENVQNPHGVRPYLYHTPQIAQTNEAHHGTTFVANSAIDWLEENENEPFFMMCGFIQPHPPWNIPAEIKGVYDDITVPDPLPISRSETDITEKNEWFGDYDSKETVQSTKKAYYTAVSMIDKYVGNILNYLRESGKLDDTLIIFTSDHGEMLYDKGYFSKELGYDGCAKIPMVVRYPKLVQQNTVEPNFVNLLDVMPTCLDVCGIEYKGTDLLYGNSMIDNDTLAKRDITISASGNGIRRWVMARTADYKYIYSYNGAIEEMYDMTSADGEVYNIFDSNAYPQEIYKKLRLAVLEYEKEWGPEECVRSGELISFPLKKFTPDVRGKYHFWSNSQMQRFFDKHDRTLRANELLSEIRIALQQPYNDGFNLSEIFDNDTWFNDFAANFHKYTGQTITKEQFYSICDNREVLNTQRLKNA